MQLARELKANEEVHPCSQAVRLARGLKAKGIHLRSLAVRWARDLNADKETHLRSQAVRLARELEARQERLLQWEKQLELRLREMGGAPAEMQSPARGMLLAGTSP